ncbi:hypothetical protein SKAU_G00009940 [Synaphobranchus kaupii]|uniref:Uncharacterized protein n=1 Tax=Synaphobranchus kaupii TaxID=118154 RepID=A0A9Q1JB36_SYNKA|nr:hypothetical protein SKAU_G00009940 [Synaphobranchus kaupii]
MAPQAEGSPQPPGDSSRRNVSRVPHHSQNVADIKRILAGEAGVTRFLRLWGQLSVPNVGRKEFPLSSSSLEKPARLERLLTEHGPPADGALAERFWRDGLSCPVLSEGVKGLAGGTGQSRTQDLSTAARPLKSQPIRYTASDESVIFYRQHLNTQMAPRIQWRATATELL